jgi:hypothetical protein
MPQNNVDDLITDQEIAFARLVFSGTMTDRQAAEAVGLNPDTASCTKSKPRVRAWMLERLAAVQQQLVQQDTEELRRFNVGRDRVLARLWDIANLDPEMTRNGMSAQVKALALIVAIEGLIPDRHSARRAVSAENKLASPPVHPPFYVSEWMRTQQQGENVNLQPPSAPDHQEGQQEAAPGSQSAPGGVDGPPRPATDPTAKELSSSRPERSVVEGPAVPGPSQTTPSPHTSRSSWVPDTREPFSIEKGLFGRRR